MQLPIAGVTTPIKARGVARPVPEVRGYHGALGNAPGNCALGFLRSESPDAIPFAVSSETAVVGTRHVWIRAHVSLSRCSELELDRDLVLSLSYHQECPPGPTQSEKKTLNTF